MNLYHIMLKFFLTLQLKKAPNKDVTDSFKDHFYG